jgi:translocation and assembly module TamA
LLNFYTHKDSELLNTLRHFKPLLCALLLLIAPLAIVAPKAMAAKPEIAISGGVKSLRENVRQHLTLSDQTCSVPQWRLNVLLGDAEAEIKAASEALGYYELEYTAELTKVADCWGLKLVLTPGEPVRVKELRIDIQGEGKLDDIFAPIYAKPELKVGNKLNHGRYETLKARFGTLAAAHGYFDADFKLAQIQVSVAEKSAIVILIYDTGPRYKIGSIQLKHGILDDDFLQRYMNIATGDYYDSDKLLELKNLYNSSNYFTVASASPNLQNLQDAQVPIVVNLEERKRRAYSVGAGVATDTGPRLLLGYEDRYINSRGHSFNLDLNTSEVKTTLQAVYNIPLRRPAFETLKLYTGYERELTDTSLSKKYTYGTQYTLFQSNHWLHTYALDYEQEESTVGKLLPVTTDLIIPWVSLARTQTDGSLYPLSGWSLLGKLSGSPESLGSDFSFVQFEGRAKYIYGGDWGRLLLRTQVGYTELDGDRALPASVSFFAGGDTSVRGYHYKSLGPLDGDGEVKGGNNLLVTSIEVDHLFKDSHWAVAAFYDQGNASDDLNFDFKRGAGLGVRWISPIGPIRIDVAKALDGDKGWALHLSMGPDL